MKELSLFNTLPEVPQKPSGPVTCLGMTFENDEARRSYFTEELRKKLQDPEFRKIEGFPIGSDEDILTLSDPPYYTACPNPWIANFIAEWEAQKPKQPEGYHYHREPFAADVSEGKNDPIYRIPSYHTKVPPKAIEKYILHYTEPGDIVLDAFCGTGMTGVASLLCKPEKRHAILIDLSPVATFTASIMNAPILDALSMEKNGPLNDFIAKELLPLYEIELDGKKQFFDYAIWSDWGECPECAESFILYDTVIDFDNSKMLSVYTCPNCGATLKSDLQKKYFNTFFDPWLNKPVRIAKNTMVMISKKIGNRAIRVAATDKDRSFAEEIGARNIDKIPMELPYSHMTHERNNLPGNWGITHIHQFYTRRNYYAISKVASIKDQALRKAGLFTVITSLENNATRRNRFYVDARRPKGSPIGPLSNTLYVPTVQVETNIGIKMQSVLRDTARNRNCWPRERSLVSTQSAIQLASIPNNSIDFIFTDPPFGGNINYSEQNILAEWWLNLFTNNKSEAITNSVQKKGISEYQAIMTQCFKEYYRVLKQGRWMVVEFHNSSNSIWSAIQQALESSGFIVTTVTILDKVHSTLHQDHKAASVDKDLAITVYKPTESFERHFEISAGSAEGAWNFVRAHLENLPIFIAKDGQAKIISERQNYLLFDRMVAFHVQRGIAVPLSASEFYSGLLKRYSERDGMFFTSEQVVEYDKKRLTVQKVIQLQLIITDEHSAIQWLNQQLSKKTQTFQELHPMFIKEISGWQKHEKSLELSVLLEQNFLRYDGKGPVPEQIHAYLSTNWKELRNLPKDDPTLVAKARDRWYVPDPRKAGDLEKLREKALLKEFEEYKEAKKKLKVFRLEAVRAGFKKAWQERDYAVIIAVAEKLPTNVMEEDPKLLMWYDQAVTRMGGE